MTRHLVFDDSKIAKGNMLGDAIAREIELALHCKRGVHTKNIRAAINELQQFGCGVINLGVEGVEIGAIIPFRKLGRTKRWRYIIETSKAFRGFPHVKKVKYGKVTAYIRNHPPHIPMFLARNMNATTLIIKRLQLKSGTEVHDIVPPSGKKYVIGKTPDNRYIVNTKYGVIDAIDVRTLSYYESVMASITYSIFRDDIERALKTGEWPDYIAAKILSAKI